MIQKRALTSAFVGGHLRRLRTRQAAVDIRDAISKKRCKVFLFTRSSAARPGIILDCQERAQGKTRNVLGLSDLGSLGPAHLVEAVTKLSSGDGRKT
jgi:hypothetical protein